MQEVVDRAAADFRKLSVGAVVVACEQVADVVRFFDQRLLVVAVVGGIAICGLRDAQAGGVPDQGVKP